MDVILTEAGKYDRPRRVERAHSSATTSPVILALDARIHAAACTSRPGIDMDCRVKPGNDSFGVTGQLA